MGTLFWLAVLGIMLLMEIGTLGLTTVWFAGGAFVTLILSFFVENPYVEWGVFLMVSVLCLVALRPLFIDKFNAKREKTNLDHLIGQTARVTVTIDNFHSRGSVNLKGQDWSARNAVSDELISEGSKVIVRDISGVKLIVEPVDEPETKESEE